MSSRLPFCRVCKVKGHTNKNCPKSQNPGDDSHHILPIPTPRQHVVTSALQQLPSLKEIDESELMPIQTLEGHVETLDIPFVQTFWFMFGIHDYHELYELASKVHSIARANMRSRDTRGNLALTFEMFKKQETSQQTEDMFISFAAIGVLSKLFESKCKILVKGKTGLFLCADILRKYGELRSVVTDDIDLVILAKQTSARDPSRKIFAQQVGAFITLCLREKFNTVSRSGASASASGAASGPRSRKEPIFVRSKDVAPCIYRCSDIIVRGQGICGTSVESRNVKVSFDVGNGKYVKIIDITYTTYHKQIDRLYSRFAKADISRDVSYFYLDVRDSIMEYVFIILDNVTRCDEYVKTHGTPAVRLKETMPMVAKKLEDRAAAASAAASCGSPGALPCAADFMDNLSDFEQATMFKFAKSAHLCASIIAEFPEFHDDSHSQQQKWELQKIIVMMQLYELSRHEIIPRKFTRVMIQTQDLLQEMVSEVILHKQDDPAVLVATKPHRRLTDRLQSVQSFKDAHPRTSFDTYRFGNVPLGVHLSTFDIRQIVDNPLTSPDASPTSQPDDDDIDRVGAAAAAHKIYRHNKDASKLAATRRKALQTVKIRPGSPDAGAGAGAGDESEDEFPSLSASRRSPTSKKDSKRQPNRSNGNGKGMGGSRRRHSRTAKKPRRLRLLRS